MSSNQIAHRYALAFYNRSVELGLVKEVLRDLFALRKSFDQNPILKMNIESSGVSLEKKIDVLKEIFVKHFTKETFLLINFLALKKRFFYLYQVAKNFQEIYDIKNGFWKLSITLSKGLSEEFAKELAKRVEENTHNKYNLIIKYDESLKGGFIYQYGDNIFDYSISGQLAEMKKKIMS